MKKNKNKNFGPKEPWPSGIIVWARELPVGSPMIKTKFPFFYSRKKNSLPKTTSFWRGFNQKELRGPAREHELACDTQASSPALH